MRSRSQMKWLVRAIMNTSSVLTQLETKRLDAFAHHPFFTDAATHSRLVYVHLPKRGLTTTANSVPACLAIATIEMLCSSDRKYTWTPCELTPRPTTNTSFTSMAGRVAIQDQGFSAVVLVRTDKQAVTTSIVWSDAIFRQPSRDADENVVILILSYGGNAELVSPPASIRPSHGVVYHTAVCQPNRCSSHPGLRPPSTTTMCVCFELLGPGVVHSAAVNPARVDIHYIGFPRPRLAEDIGGRGRPGGLRRFPLDGGGCAGCLSQPGDGYCIPISRGGRLAARAWLNNDARKCSSTVRREGEMASSDLESDDGLTTSLMTDAVLSLWTP
jgi:hypothetical protein